eukprot:scaffold7297_cov28-Tisochrysis_lutea.AAC.1
MGEVTATVCGHLAAARAKATRAQVYRRGRRRCTGVSKQCAAHASACLSWGARARTNGAIWYSAREGRCVSVFARPIRPIRRGGGEGSTFTAT